MAMNIIITLPAGETMFSIIVDGETVETVIYDEASEVRKYIRENYEFYGEKASFKRIGE